MGPSSLPTATTTSRKRKMTEEELEAADRPTKLPAIGTTRTLRPSTRATNLSSSTSAPRLGGLGFPSLTKPQAPNFGRSTTATATKRSTSAPPNNANATTAGRSTIARPTTAIASRPTAGRLASGSRPGVTTRATAKATNGASGSDGKHFQALQSRVTSIEAARAADAAKLAADMEAERQKVTELQANHLALSHQLAQAKSQELTHRRELDNFNDELDQLRKKHAREIMDLEMDLRKKERELREAREDLRVKNEDLERERAAVASLKMTISQQSTAHLGLTTQNGAMVAQNQALQMLVDQTTAALGQLKLDLETRDKRIEELEQEARESEGVRRKLHNMVQELKGNIRVFCRVRPVLPSDLPEDDEQRDEEEVKQVKKDLAANVGFPDRKDHKEIVLKSCSENAMGQERKEVWNFNFDRVFEPHSTQMEVFDEVSQLAQSCVDGYNVCIFAYGQTGSGKSFTMEGGSTDATVGMIPRAVERVFRAAEDLKSKGWEYKMEGQFLEIYNETINDLLGKGEFDKKKHEIKHDKTGTRVTDVVVVPLSSATQVRSLLALAQSRRTVAATLMNERSSRSHSVFTLRIFGCNEHTGEKCDGSLNLVDLAGSERLKESGAASDKDRLKETQNINKSLSALGDVIAALGEKSDKSDKHIPYRNSKLTYLLQNSLSGNSKTLMILNVSPLAAHLNESLCSLRFATKVNNTTIGTAKKQTRNS